MEQFDKVLETIMYVVKAFKKFFEDLFAEFKVTEEEAK